VGFETPTGDELRRGASGWGRFLAVAFVDDPFMSWLFGSSARLVEHLAGYYRRDVQHRLASQAHAVVEPGRGIAFWHPPGQAGVSPRVQRAIMPAFIPAAIRHPWRTRRAAMVTRSLLASHPTEPHWYLSHLAVAPDARRQGLGRALVDAGVALATQAGVGAYLETANPANLPLYRRAGFDEVGCVALDDVPPVWQLWRPYS
jgi:ribosomal protein S18 acetylase RimI-like enzyme